MMSSAATSSPVSASTLAYLMRWPVLRLIWLKETFSVSEVAGYKATGQVTSERRRKPFQLARGAMGILRKRNRSTDQGYHRGTRIQVRGARIRLAALTAAGRPRRRRGAAGALSHDLLGLPIGCVRRLDQRYNLKNSQRRWRHARKS